MKKLSLCLLALAVMLGVPSYGQPTLRGYPRGNVQDASGATVADATVTVKNLDTNAIWETTTTEDGLFRVRQLPIGNYQVNVEKGGFTRYVQGPIVLRLNQNANLPVKLEVSGLTEVVSVQADATMVNTTNAEVSANFESKRVSELPLAVNRNVLNLALSVPGVSQLSSGQSTFASERCEFLL